jgi:hypothetical protein
LKLIAIVALPPDARLLREEDNTSKRLKQKLRQNRFDRVRELRGFCVTGVPLTLTQGLLVKINQQHVFHSSASPMQIGQGVLIPNPINSCANGSGIPNPRQMPWSRMHKDSWELV